MKNIHRIVNIIIEGHWFEGNLLVEFSISSFAWFIDGVFGENCSSDGQTTSDVQMLLHPGQMMTFQLWSWTTTSACSRFTSHLKTKRRKNREEKRKQLKIIWFRVESPQHKNYVTKRFWLEVRATVFLHFSSSHFNFIIQLIDWIFIENEKIYLENILFGGEDR